MADSVDADAESARVEEILQGAQRNPNDPDTNLFRMLVELDQRPQHDLSAYLEGLLRDADSDRS